jgi:hypothetical protein
MSHKARKGMLAALMGAALLAGAGAAWAQAEPDTAPEGYGYKYRADMACGESWIKVCKL